MKTDLTQPRPNDENGDIPDHFFRELDVQLLVHELKDPTGIIITALRSLLEKKEKYGPLLPRQERALKRAFKAVLQTQYLLNDLLEIGRAEACQFIYNGFQPKNVVYKCFLDALALMEGELFEQLQEYRCESKALNLLAHAGICFTIASEVEELEIIQDETKFRQIVGNLIKNALRFRSKRLEIRLYQKGEWLCVEVEDDGPGIRPEDYDLIFRRYTQVKGGESLERKGHGLGLAGALIQARRLGGNIILQSEAGKGALFRFTVPAKRENDKGKG